MLKFLNSLLSAMWSRRPASPKAVLIDVASEISLPVEVSSLRQGDIVALGSLPLKWDSPGELECNEGAVLISQTCDLVKSHRAEVQVALVVRLEEHDASQARSGRLPRYAPLPELGPNYFADLGFIATVHKSLVIGNVHSHGLDQKSHQQVSKFSRAVGRRFDRFAFPDEITPWIKPLQDILRSKAPKMGSPIYRPVQHITELRLEAVQGWTADPPYDLTLLVIVSPGVLPELNGEPDEPRNQRKLIQETIAEVAKGIPPDGAPTIDVLRFWESFGDALARHCRPSDTAPKAVREAVRSLSAEVLSEDDLSYARVLRSAEIDLDHLS